jgi:hypothetical protein
MCCRALVVLVVTRTLYIICFSPEIYNFENLSVAPVQGALLLDVVVGEGAAVLELLAREDEALLVRGDALLVLDLGLDVLD